MTMMVKFFGIRFKQLKHGRGGSAKKHVIPEGYTIVPVEMSWRKSDEIAIEHWNRYQYSHEVQYQGQNALSSSIELARLRWCKK